MKFDTVELRICPVCRFGKRRMLYEVAQTAVFQCSNCGLRYIDPCLSQSAMSAAYESENTLKKLHNFHSHYYRYGSLDDDSVTRKEYLKGLMLLESGLSTKNPKLMDVGYGSGFFLALAKKRGWEVDGIDTSKTNQKLSCERFGLSLKTGDFEFDIPDAPCFDAVTFWDVIEHLPDPIRLIQKAKRILKPGGTILAAMPHDHSFLRYLAEGLYYASGGRFCDGLNKIYMLEHVAYYNLRSLKELFSRQKFDLRDWFFSDTDLNKYALPRGEKFLAEIILLFGKIFHMQNRLIAIFNDRIS